LLRLFLIQLKSGDISPLTKSQKETRLLLELTNYHLIESGQSECQKKRAPTIGFSLVRLGANSCWKPLIITAFKLGNCTNPRADYEIQLIGAESLDVEILNEEWLIVSFGRKRK
jgi:hypothetical protein